MARKTHTIQDENLGQLQLRQGQDDAPPTIHNEDGDEFSADDPDRDDAILALLDSLFSGEGTPGEMADEDEKEMLGGE